MRQASSAGCDSCACAVTDSCSQVKHIMRSTSGLVHAPMNIQTWIFKGGSSCLKALCMEAASRLYATASVLHWSMQVASLHSYDWRCLMLLCRAISARALAAAVRPTQQICAAGLAAIPSSLPSRCVSVSALNRRLCMMQLSLANMWICPHAVCTAAGTASLLPDDSLLWEHEPRIAAVCRAAQA